MGCTFYKTITVRYFRTCFSCLGWFHWRGSFLEMIKATGTWVWERPLADSMIRKKKKRKQNSRNPFSLVELSFVQLLSCLSCCFPLLCLQRFAFWLLYLHSRGVSTLWEVKEICLIRLTNHEIIIFNTPQEAKQNAESHAEVQPPLLIEDIEGQVGQKLTNQNCCSPLFPLRNIFIFITLVPGCSAVN